MPTYFPRNYIPLPRGGEEVIHFLTRCLVAYYVFKKNGGEKDWTGQRVVESEKHILRNRRFRADVYDPFTKLVFEVETRANSQKFKKKVKAYEYSGDVKGVKLICTPWLLDAQIEEGIKEFAKKIEHFVRVAAP